MKLALSVALIATVVVVDKPVTLRSGTVHPALLSREPELRASRNFRRPPLTGRRRAPRDPAWAHGQQRWHNWTAVAQCESSGHWHDNTGNGFYGGLQFTLSTWRAYGGRGWPQDASEGTQIGVAERVLVGQGIGAWPYCGRFL